MGTVIKSIPAPATWPLRHAVMWPDKPIDYVKLPQDHLGLHFGLFRDEELVTVASLFIIDDKAQFRKLATKTSEQGKGYGSLMLEHLLKVADSKGVEKIWCNARKEKTGFYHKLGLKETTQTFSKGKNNYVIMEKMLP